MSTTTAQQVFNALNNYLVPGQGGTINLSAAANGSATLNPMISMLLLFGIDTATDSYTVSGTNLSISTDKGTTILSGSGTFHDPGNTDASGSYNVNVNLVYTQSDGVFVMKLSVTKDWSFTFFKNLPQTLMQNPLVAIGIRWYDSILNKFTIRNAIFTGKSGTDQVLQLSGSLLEPTDTYILEKTPMIGPWPLALSGTIELTTSTRDYPILDLDAIGNPTAIIAGKEQDVEGPSIFQLQNPGITLVADKLVPPQAEVDAFSTLELFGDFSLNGIAGRISTLILSTGDTWNFTVIFGKDATLVKGLVQLMDLFGVVLPIPMDFPVLSDFYVAELDIDLQITGTNGLIPTFTLSAFAITIKSDKTWKPPVPFVTINEVGTRWVWAWTTVINEVGQSEKTYSMTGSVFGTFNFGSDGDGKALPEPDPNQPDSPEGVGAGSGGNSVAIRTSMSLPNFLISAYMKDGDFIPIGEAFTYFFGNPGPSTGSPDMNITRLRVSADPLGQNYYADATIFFGDPTDPDPQQGWEINLGITTVLLQQLDFYIQVLNGSVGGGISGVFYLEQDDPADYTLPRIDLSAEYPVQDPNTPIGWKLSGMLYPGTSIDLSKIVYRFIYGDQGTLPDWIPQVTIDRLYAEFTTGTSGVQQPSYKFGGTLTARWNPVIFNQQLKITTSASVDVDKPATSATASGKIVGQFSVNRLMLEAALTFGVPEPTYQFKIQFDEIWLQATTSWRGTDPNRHQVVSIQLGGLTLGDMLEYLVNLAEPTLGFQLDSPWDVLKQIELSQFVLTVDPTDNIIEFVFNTNVDLVIAKLTSVGVRYSKVNGENKVDMILTGSFLGEAYTPEDPLSWDVINGSPPEVPGEGKSLVDLRYLGIGQRVTFSGATPDTVKASVDLLRAQMQEPPADGDPMGNSSLQYSSESQWLMGLDVKLMDTLDLAFIFNDPKLYGLSIGLSGERAGALAGLKFEILYKKITDDIGMFRVEFQVPDMFRTIQLGVVSITLGIIVVEIYTNGNFKVDLGFPYNRNFDRSFSIQASIFIGRGGFYLGILNGDTSTQVPRISNGNFSPVIELGIGIAAGVGREVRAGILSGGAYIQIEVIFQGVMAWFNPNSSGTPSATYFKCQGIIAIHGKIYGSVDFAVIKVSVTLEAYAQASISYESYQPMLIELSARVSAKASIKILFIRIHFSFSVSVEFSFTVGSAQPTPWILDSSAQSSGSNQQVGYAQRNLTLGNTRNYAHTIRLNKHRRKIALKQEHFNALNLKRRATTRSSGIVSFLLTGDSSYTLQWNPSQQVFSDAPRDAHMTLLPVFTIADVPVEWDENIPANSNPNYRTAFVLFADTGMSPEAQNAEACAIRSSVHSAMGSNDDTSTLAADILTEGLVRYAINALMIPTDQGNTITAGQLEFLLEELNLPETLDTGLSMDSLSTFFQTNINLWISGDPGTVPDEKGAMVIPMPPFLSWTSTQVGNVDFNTKNEIGSLYEWGISQLLKSYSPANQEYGEQPTDDNPSEYESFTTFMFRDFCLMIMQNSLEEAQKHLENTTVTVASDSGTVQSLADISNSLPQAEVSYIIQSGDTVESVAEHLGATPDELVFLNPLLETQLSTDPVGTSITIKLGVPPQTLATDNSSKPFAVQQCSLGIVVHPAAVTDTLNSIASLFQTSAPEMLAFSSQELPVLSTSIGILQQGALFTMPEQTFSDAPSDYDQLRTAAAFFVRYSDTGTFAATEVPAMADWYTQAIAEINDTLLETLFPNQHIPSSVELPPGQVLSVPAAYQNAYNTDINVNRVNYTTIPGDTLSRIGYVLSLQQNYATTSPEGVPQWQTFLAGVTSAGTNAWSIPEQQNVAVRSGETIVVLARRMVLNVIWTPGATPSEGTWTYDWNAIVEWLGGALILQPVATITVPDASTAQHNPLSFDVIEQIYGVSVTEAATALQNLNGLFAENTVLDVKLLPAQDIDVLMNAILQGDSFASIVNQSSRMLMSGLQLPGLKTEDGHTIPDTSVRFPLYDLTGQQVSVTVDPNQLTETALAIALTSQSEWITLFDSITVTSDDTLAELEVQYPDLLTYNPGLSESTFQVGMVLLTQPVTTSLDYSYTSQQVLDNSPASGLSVVPEPSSENAPSKMSLSGTVPKTYGLEQKMVLQTPVTLPIPEVPGQENVSGNPSLWTFPQDFLLKALSGITTKYDILYTQTGAKAGAESTLIENATYGLIVPFKIKQLNASTNKFELIGVDTLYRQLLLTLRSWLLGQPESDPTKAYLLLSPAPNANNTSGLIVLTAEPADSYLIKSNLSTESLPPANNSFRVRGTEDDTQLYTSTLASLADFVTLLWEGSVVGGTGFYFGAGQTIPASAIDSQGNITLQLMVIAGTQQDLEPQGRALLPFNNCVLIGAGLDTSEKTLFIESSDDSETITQALVPPGNVGFTLLTDNPATTTIPYTTQEIALKNLYSMMSYSVVAQNGSPFVSPESWTPVVASPSDGSTLETWKKQKALRQARRFNAAKKSVYQQDSEEETYWYYEQVLPVSNFVSGEEPDAAPLVSGLPLPENDPYRGYGMQTTIPSAYFSFGFADLLGNRTGNNGTGQGTTTIEVGYTDNLVGLAEWPTIASYFEVKQVTGGTSAELHTVISYRSSELIPSPSENGLTYASMIQQQISKYATIYYQLIQNNIEGWMVSSLKLVEDQDYGNKGLQLDNVRPLWQFAGGAYATANTLSGFTSAEPVNASTLGEIISVYGVRYAELAQANSQLLASDLFDSQIPVVPAYFPFIENQSIAMLYAGDNIPSGWPKPANAVDLLKSTENQELLLKKGIALKIPVRTQSTGTNQSISQIAATAKTSVELLAGDNASATLLALGFEFSVSIDDDTEVTVTVDSTTNSLDLVKAKYAENGVQVTSVSLAVLNQATPGMFVDDQNLNVNNYIVLDGETLDDNDSGISADTLAENNVNTINIFDPGALVYLGDFSGVTLGDNGTTLQQFADRYACPPELLLSANSTFTSGKFVLPGTLQWPAVTDTLRTPYNLLSTDTWNGITAKFSTPDGTGNPNFLLATMNQFVSLVFIPDSTLSISVSGTSYSVNTGSEASFAAVLSSLQEQAPLASMQDVVDSIAATDDILQAATMILCPPAKLQANTKPDELAGLYGISASEFGMLNAAMQGLVLSGQQLKMSAVTITTGENDTLNTLVTRFADQGVSASVSDIMTDPYNETVAFLQYRAIALLPPGKIDLSVNIGTGGPYPAPISPLEVMLRFIRPEALIDPEFKTAKGIGPVEMVESGIAAPTKNAVDGSGLTFNDFVAEMKLALPNLRLATGRVEGIQQDLWIVNFDADGIAEVGLAGALTINETSQPRFFALTPLYNHLVTRSDISIQPLNDDGTLATAQSIAFQSIDTELWARRFVADVDQFLSGEYATALYAIPETRPYLSSVLSSKETLLPKIAAGLDKILDLSASGDNEALINAQKSLEQQLGISLSRAYQANVLFQYNSTVQSAWQNPDSTLAPAALYGEGVIPTSFVNGVSIVSAKTHLEEASSFVDFLMTLDNPSLHRNVTGEFNYSFTNIEFNESTADVPEGYTASDWLTFIPIQDAAEKPSALSGTNPGEVEIPVPLRIFPGLPILMGQTAAQSYPDELGRSADQLAVWDYSLTYSHEHAEQDYLKLAFEINLQPDSANLRMASLNQDLFTELAQYNTIASKLWDDLNGLVDPASKVPPATLENAASTFADLVERVAEFWDMRITQEQARLSATQGLVTDQTFYFDARVTYRESTGMLGSYTLKELSGTPGPNGTWPEVYLELTDEETGVSVSKQLDAGTPANGELIYSVPDALNIPPTTWPVFRLVWDKLNLAEVQNARSYMWVQRNQNLINDVTTNPHFLFATDVVIAPSVVTPINMFGERVDINSLGSSLTDALNTLFSELFDENQNGQKITMELSYGYELVPPSLENGSGLVTYLPIGLYPNQTISANTATEINGIIETWKSINQPRQTGGEWAFSLKLYSQLTENPQTLMNIQHIIFKISNG